MTNGKGRSAAGDQAGEHVHTPDGNQDPEPAAGGCQQQALGQELANNPRASGTRGLTHGQFLMPVDRASQNQPGHIDAVDG